MQWKLGAIVLNTAVMAVAAVDILVQPIGSAKTEVLGHVTLDPEPSYQRALSGFEGPACVGVNTKDNGFECSVLTTIADEGDERIVLHLNPLGEPMRVDYSHNTTSKHGNKVTVVNWPPHGPEPLLKKPVPMKDNKVVEPEPQKSFIQKYWMYIVPFLLLMLVSGGGGEQ